MFPLAVTRLKGKSACCIISHGKRNRNSELHTALPGALLTERRHVSSWTAISSSHTFTRTHHFLTFRISNPMCPSFNYLYPHRRDAEGCCSFKDLLTHLQMNDTPRGSRLVKGSAHCYSTPSSMYVMQIMQNFPTLNAYLSKQRILQSTVYNIQKSA